MTKTGTTGDQPIGAEAGAEEGGVQYEKNVPQEQVQNNDKWDTGTEKDLPTTDKNEYRDQVSDEYAKNGAGTGGADTDSVHFRNSQKDAGCSSNSWNPHWVVLVPLGKIP